VRLERGLLTRAELFRATGAGHADRQVPQH
jgi:hypothetical protein